MNAKIRNPNQRSEENEKKEKEEMKRKKRKGKEGFPIEDRKKVKRKKGKGSKEKQNNFRSIQETRKENKRSSD